MLIDALKFDLLRMLWDSYPDGWEPTGGTNLEFFDYFIDLGFIKRVDGRCGFEAFKDSHIVFTKAGQMFFELEAIVRKETNYQTHQN